MLSRQGQPPLAYVGRQACLECHRGEYDSWVGSHHDLAMQVANHDTVLGDFHDEVFTHNGVTSTFAIRDAGFFVTTDGPDGSLQEYRVTHTFGVTPLQQYLVQFPGGRYQVLPLCWDTRPADEGGRRWFHIYPDEVIGHDDVLHWTGPNQNWNFMCAECHSTDLKRNYDLQSDSYNTSWAEIDVSCEACHGPGSRHIQRPGTGGFPVRLRDDDGGGWVMDMTSGTAKRTVPRRSRAQVETCARCHSRRRQIDDNVVPGRPLLDTHVPSLLGERLYHADGQILDEVYVYGSFLQSRMYHEGVTCSDCHDPHSLKLLAPGNALCAKCHLPDRFDAPGHHHHRSGGPGASCVECHMPSRTYMVVDPRHDHSFRIPRPDLTVSIGTPNACNQCHRDRSAQWAADAVDGWYGTRGPHWGEALHAGRSGLPGAVDDLAGLVQDREVPGIVRGSALRLLSAYAGPTALAAVEIALADPDPLVRASAVGALEFAGAQERLRLAVPALEDPVRAVRISAARVLAPVTAAPSAEFVASELTNAERPESHVNLGNFYGQQGRFEQAESSYRTALRLNPRHVPAYVNLADLYRVIGHDDQGEPLLRTALDIAPRSAPAHHALGLLLIRQGKKPQALDPLRRAAELAPDNARFVYVYKELERALRQ